MSIEELLKSNNIEVIVSKKRDILSSLRSLDKKEREYAWKALSLIVKFSKEKITNKDKMFIRSLLWNKYREVREDAWRNLELFKYLNIKGVERTLNANSDKLKFSAWANVISMIELGFVEKDDIIQLRYSFWRLLKSRIGTIRRKSWKLFVELVDAGIFLPADKERFKAYLSHKKMGIRINAWSTVPKLLEKKFLNYEDIKNEIKEIESISELKNRIGYKAKYILDNISKIIKDFK